jgi:hypothetical protein
MKYAGVWSKADEGKYDLFPRVGDQIADVYFPEDWRVRPDDGFVKRADGMSTKTGIPPRMLLVVLSVEEAGLRIAQYGESEPLEPLADQAGLCEGWDVDNRVWVAGTFVLCRPVGPIEEARTGKGFDEALLALKAGKAIQRQGWNGKGQFVQMQVPDLHSKMTLPYLYITTVDGKRVPWLASQTDLLAEDWTVLTEEGN